MKSISVKPKYQVGEEVYYKKFGKISSPYCIEQAIGEFTINSILVLHHNIGEDNKDNIEIKYSPCTDFPDIEQESWNEEELFPTKAAAEQFLRNDDYFKAINPELFESEQELRNRIIAEKQLEIQQDEEKLEEKQKELTRLIGD